MKSCLGDSLYLISNDCTITKYCTHLYVYNDNNYDNAYSLCCVYIFGIQAEMPVNRTNGVDQNNWKALCQQKSWLAKEVRCISKATKVTIVMTTELSICKFRYIENVLLLFFFFIHCVIT